ncbi:hypothetical protein A3F66_06610 [candidate division TM6 bacterium RIFCSPHIGHO2_12_FULL_32_22]|nr:MAG: hypothetical protein A3F66_06610 [candidate division TM6 bacterium RIFCSPHIGHO2_12_FULL_32_22]
MKFRKFRSDKLWRDKIVDEVEASGSKIHFKVLDDNEFKEQLKHKFIEEAEEVFASRNKQELIEELADILEVINSFISQKIVSSIALSFTFFFFEKE